MRTTLRVAALCLAGLSGFLLLGGCRPLSDGLVDSGRSVLRALAGVETGAVELPAGRIAYLLRDAPGPTVVLLHGFASEKDSWLRFMRSIPGEYRLLALDLPGHGGSSRDVETNYSIDTIVTSVESAIHELTEGPVHMTGTSLGGMVAAIYSARNIDRVITLTLYAPAGVYPPKPSEFQRMLDRGENPLIAHNPEEFDRLMEMVFFDPPPLVWPVGASLRRYSVARADFHTKIWNDLWPDHPTLDGYLPTIDIPVLLVWGANDRVLDVSSVEVFQRELPDVQTVVVDELGHATVNERPREMARIQLDFLGRHRGAAAAR